MTEATWGDAIVPHPDWRMSAALENVPRGDSDVAEVTSLEQAVRAWTTLDSDHRRRAVLTSEKPIEVGGVLTATFTGEAIAALAERLPEARNDA